MSEVAQTVITEVYDAINDKTAHIAMGTVKFVSIKRINADGSPKTVNIKVAGVDKAIKSSHRVSILLEQGTDSTWISFGEENIDLRYEGNYQIKEAEKTYTNILPGMVLRLPVDRQEYVSKKTGEKAVSYTGKKKHIVIKDRSNAQQPQAGATGGSAGSSANSGTSTKVYGEIIALDGLVASVKGDKGEWKVTLTEDQVSSNSQVQVGGRLACQLAADGSVSGFKAYGPVGQGASSSRSFKKDDLPIRIGNAVSIVHAMFPAKPVTTLKTEIVQTVDVMDGLRAKLSAEFKGSMDDYSIGARLGQSGIVAAPHGAESPAAFSSLVEDTFRMICTIEEELRAKQATPAANSEPAATQPAATPAKELEPQAPLNYSPDPVDFDMDIPF